MEAYTFFSNITNSAYLGVVPFFSPLEPTGSIGASRIINKGRRPHHLLKHRIATALGIAIAMLRHNLENYVGKIFCWLWIENTI